MARIEDVISGKVSKWKYALDVLGHAGIGAGASVLPIAAAVFFLHVGFGISMAIGQPFAIGAGAFREWRQYKKTGKLHPLDRSLDIAHHVLGPPIAWGIVNGIQAAIN